ncbi:peptidase inhibitor family I36 protein [Streptomyces sp. NPDC087440]|uniref:peptidase inhibitor family I36 protein n=1 Tax=Streptomyces sp. NPDC087440 TaxID=3365790 RepID=UPI003828C3AB
MTTLRLMRAAVTTIAAALPLLLTAPTAHATVQSRAAQVAEIACPDGYVCIYPEISFGGQPWVKRAVDGSVKDLPSSIRDRGSSIRNNSDRTARVYEKRNHSGRWVCVTRSGGSIHDLRSYDLNDQTRSLKINDNDCG